MRGPYSTPIHTKVANHPVPVTHHLEVLLSRDPSLVLRVSRVATDNGGFDLHQLHTLSASIETIAHSGIASLAKRSGKSFAMGVA